MKRRDRVRFLLLILLLEGALCVSLLSSEAFYSTAPEAMMAPLPPVQMPAAPLPPRPPLPWTPSQPPIEKPAAHQVLKRYAFQGPSALEGWEEKVFRGRSEYRPVEGQGSAYLSAASSGTSSGLFMKLDLDVEPGTELAWSWRATEFPRKPKPDQLADRGQDDFAARLYVIFPGPSYFKTDVIEYLWDGDIPEGTVSSSPFSGRVKLFVIRKGPGPEESGGWVFERRDLYKDYVDLFEKMPKRPLGAIAVMSDSDNTGTSSRADFGTIEIRKINEGGAPT